MIPEEEAAAEQPPPPPPLEPEPEADEPVEVGDEAAGGGGAGDGGAGGGEGGGGGGGALPPALEEEAEALGTRVAELERLTHKGCAPAMRTLVAQRLATVDERLTNLMIAIDGASVGEGAGREAKRALTRRMDALGLRVAAITLV